ncbi:ABC transporter, ATP-binding protein [Mycoplasma haemocanis str. Illinois]|uniref:ABC transporter, ATP-binding protein n=1 Tax=Mycoplasma haemocanis (strain Illinois) TaxID=1111676 RepID=H6N5V5_MYCHN|nr:ATP-binding cassette domain-containing protein [Mycoplasma haemocanis]AEW44870.1 ABC transporter, ATP-binding protein [Mycoplasma haemocanis str. Illinois]
MSSEDKGKILEYQELKKSFQELEKEEKQLKDYLSINVFNYAQNKDNLEDVFAINNSSLDFYEQTKGCSNLNANIALLEINYLTKYYASRKIPSLLNVNLRIYLGDLHVIVGSNGSGKTTLFNCLRGLEDYEGEILLDGKVLDLKGGFSDIASFVPYEFGWDLYETVEEVVFKRFSDLNLTEVEAHNYIRSALEQFNLSYLRNYSIIDLSLLEKRKLQVIISLISDPNLIVFDEVFLGLQQHECLDLLVIFSKLKRENRSILVFSHSFDDFSKFANTISILSKGKIYYSGLVENLFLTQQNKYSIVTMDNKVALSVLSKIKCSYSYNELVDTIYVKFDGKLNMLLFQKECSSRNVVIKEIKPMETSINDLYPILVKAGSKQAIKDINTQTYFTPK